MQELTYYKRIKKLDDLTQEERDFLERYYACGQKSVAKMFPNNKSQQTRWSSWLHRHKQIINRIERKSSQSLLVDVAAAKSYIQKETIQLIDRLKKEPVLKAAKQIISALDLLGRVSGIGTAQQAELDTIRQEQGDLLSRLSDEQLDKLSKLVSDSVASLGYSGAEVADVVSDSPSGSGSASGIGATSGIGGQMGISLGDEDTGAGTPPPIPPHGERAGAVPFRECLVASDVEYTHKSEIESAHESEIQSALKAEIESAPMSMTPAIPLK